MSAVACSLFAVTTAVATCCTPVLADFVPISRHSIVAADIQHSGQPPVHNEQSLDTFGPFDGTTGASIFGAHQVSSITASTASVSITASGGVIFNPSATGVTTYSEFTFVFDLQVPGSFTLTGSWSASGSTLVRLSGPSGTFAPPMGDFDLSGPLLPGQYTFQVIAGQFQSGGATVDALLTVVPTPGAATLMACATFVAVGIRRSRPRL